MKLLASPTESPYCSEKFAKWKILTSSGYQARGVTMEILNLGGSDEGAPVPKRSLSRYKKAGLGLALVAVAATVSTTLAGAININGGSNGTGSVTFGQGVATTASCDDQITLSPTSRYGSAPVDSQYNGVDGTTYGNWYNQLEDYSDTDYIMPNKFWLQNLTVSDIASGCLGKRLSLNFYDADGNRLNAYPFLVDYVANNWDGQIPFMEPYAYNNPYEEYDANMLEVLNYNSTNGGTNSLGSAGNNGFVIHNLDDWWNYDVNCDGGFCGTFKSTDVVRITVESSDIPTGTTWDTSCYYCSTKHASTQIPIKRNSGKHSQA